MNISHWPTNISSLIIYNRPPFFQKKKKNAHTCDPNIFLSKKYSITNNLITRDSGLNVKVLFLHLFEYHVFISL